ncbi:Omp85 family outer membrane protein [Pontibacter sp. G13]|uniref:Omp85 family outer membrane protein n=1 Tax=Pontibacter sp. G13 TaxID=3074898 RepID=UPI00288B57BC|nr:BamA/TamA family outer membrane protein [Pontibacter sp. G13]WNJ20332.1 BamA/TamA family outer membrane protein [Pontibacter sp. G13]
MSKSLSLLLGAWLMLGFTQLAYSQTESSESAQEVKTGFNVGAVPGVGYDADLGFMYGVVGNIYHYGDGSQFPRYNHSLYVQLLGYTKGTTSLNLTYNSFTLIPSVQTTASLSYVNNQAEQFYGFNGYETVYNADWTDQSSPDYLTRMFYRHDRKLVQGYANLQDTIGSSKFQWIAGVEINHYDIGSVNLEKLNDGRDDEDKLPEVPGIYDRYVDWGLIGEDEADGGWFNSIKLGLIYDNRDRLTNPTKGMFTQLMFRAGPDFIGNDQSFYKFSIIHRQYLSLPKLPLTFAYRLWYEKNLGNQLPFYGQSLLTNGTPTLGAGGQRTMRGILRNRVLGEDIFMFTAEMRWTMVHFQFLKQKWYIGSNIFLDGAQATRLIDVDPSQIPAEEYAQFFAPGTEGMHMSAGGGLKFVMNQNFCVAADYGIALDDRDGSSGFYLVMDYMF